MYLEKETFQAVIASTPLISIDLVIKNTQSEYLLGYRTNKPAKGFWFVPGGRILKDESLAKAFKRLTSEELGREYRIDQARFIGPFDHFYQDNVFGDEFSTHYVAIGYELQLSEGLSHLPADIQHQNYQWLGIDAVEASDLVHENTKKYFGKL